MSLCNWLHLSDWHQGRPDFDRTVVRDQLIADIQKRAAIDPALATLHSVIFSGDITWSGQADEFNAARRDVFEPVLKAAELGPEKLFLVPGNHDLDRKKFKYLPGGLGSPLTDHDQVKAWLDNGEGQKHALNPFGTYESFVSGYTGQPQPAYASVQDWQVGGHRKFARPRYRVGR